MGATRRFRWGLIGVVAALAGCGGDGADPPSDPTPTAPAVSPSPSPSQSPTPDQAAEFEFEIAGGRASPPLDRATVPRGSPVRIVVTSDQPDELHLHGYDLSAPIGPDEPGVIEFTADQTGLFELETHETGLVLLQLLVE